MKKQLLSTVIISSLILGFAQCSSNTNPPASQSGTEEKKVPPSAADLGREVFEERCVICHGSDGTAGVASAANLQTSRMDSISVTQVITNGRNTMPPFKGQLNAEEIENVAHYVHSLRK